MLRWFIRKNQACCRWLERYLPNARGHTYPVYPEVVGRWLNREDTRVVVDVGGGRNCAFAAERDPQWAGMVVAVDIAAEELLQNESVEGRIVSDVTVGLPFRDGAVDLVASRSVLEHLRNLEGFVAGANRALRPGGYFIHWVPNKFAPFALVNQALPNALARKLLYYLEPGVKGICGFPAVYDRCYPSALRTVFEKHGFEIAELRPSYYQSQYYAFFVPAYLLSCLYELTVQFLGLTNLCAHVLVVARKL